MLSSCNKTEYINQQGHYVRDNSEHLIMEAILLIHIVGMMTHGVQLEMMMVKNIRCHWYYTSVYC